MSAKSPTTLKDIETFIAESISGFENATNINELRLQTYRTAFDAIMEELKTYRPILAKIKEAYDISLSDAREVRKELSETQQNILLINENCEARLGLWGIIFLIRFLVSVFKIILYSTAHHQSSKKGPILVDR